jgi:hypothetical protein
MDAVVGLPVIPGTVQTGGLLGGNGAATLIASFR